jgi:hypothetical protein
VRRCAGAVRPASPAGARRTGCGGTLRTNHTTGGSLNLPKCGAMFRNSHLRCEFLCAGKKQTHHNNLKRPGASLNSRLTISSYILVLSVFSELNLFFNGNSFFDHFAVLNFFRGRFTVARLPMRGTSGSVRRSPANPARPGREQRYRDHFVRRGVPEVPLICSAPVHLSVA